MTPRDPEIQAEIIRTHGQLKLMRNPYEPVWREASDFALPRRSNWDIGTTTIVSSRGFNTRAIQACKLQTYGFAGYMVSRTKQWFKLQIKDARYEDETGVQTFLEELGVIAAAEIQRSNFYAQNTLLVADGGSIGTGVMSMEEDLVTGKARFSTRHPKECWLAEGEDGIVDTVYREFRITYRQMAQKWRGQLSESIMRKVTDTPYTYVRILHAVFPRGDCVEGSPFNVQKRYASYYISLTDAEVLEEAGYDSLPYVAFRWFKNTDETYGRSPAMDALTDILRLNQVSKSQLELAQKVSDPPMNIPETMRESVRLSAGGRNYTDGSETIAPIQLGANYPITIEVEQALEKVINEHFNVDFYLTLAQIDREMTAREVLERKGEMAAVQGATIGSYESEVAAPVIEFVVNMIFRQGKAPEIPAVLRDNGGHIDIEYTGYLSQLQKKYYSTSGITSALEVMMPLMQAFPDTIDNVDTDALLREAAESFGLPAPIMREKPAMLALRKAKQQAAAQAAAQQAQAAQQAELMKNASGLNQPVEPRSPLAGILAAVGGQAQGARQ